MRTRGGELTTERLARTTELALPGLLVGVIAGAVAGGLAGLAGQPASWAIVGMVTLAVPLGVLGGGYSLLVAQRKVRIGGFTPVMLYWLAGFPVARVLHEVVTRLVMTGEPGFPPDAWGFLAYQALVSGGFAIGFLWLHERIAPRLWLRYASRNQGAAAIYDAYVAYARQFYEAKQAKKARRRPVKHES